MERWTTPTLAGRIVRLEPLAAAHADDLWEASRDPRVWRWLPVVQPATRDEWSAHFDGTDACVAPVLTLSEAVDEAERRAIEAALARCENDLARVARELAVSSTTLWRKMKRLGIESRAPAG